MSTIFSPQTYNRGEVETSTDNLLSDGDLEDSGFRLPESTNLSIFSEQWSICSSATGTGGAYDAVKVSEAVWEGEKNLRLSISTAGAPDNQVQVMSPHFDVVPGGTYVFTCRVGKYGTGIDRAYIRIAGGSTDSLTEYPGSNIGNAIPTSPTYEDQSPPSLGSAQPYNTSLYTTVTLIWTVPAGVTRCAVRLFNWKTAAGASVVFDDFRVTQVKRGANEGLDTLWVPLTLQNGWIPYGGEYTPPAVRRIGNVVYLRGLIRDGTTTANTPVATLHPIFRPEYRRIFTTQTVTNGWARLDVQATTGNVLTSGNASTWLSLDVPPWVVTTL